MPQYTYVFSQKKSVGRIFFFCGLKFSKKLLHFWRFFKNISIYNFIFIVYTKSLEILSSFLGKNLVTWFLFFGKLQCRKAKRPTIKKQRKYKNTDSYFHLYNWAKFLKLPFHIFWVLISTNLKNNGTNQPTTFFHSII